MPAARPATLGEPYSRHLGGELSEPRFVLDGSAVRITHRLAPERRIVLLTVFRRTRWRGRAEVDRAYRAQKEREALHGPAEHDHERIRGERGPLRMEDPPEPGTAR
ncbi:hypothetical protein SUDANB121_01094 [Nocardiopsis dassonvillei]